MFKSSWKTTYLAVVVALTFAGVAAAPRATAASEANHVSNAVGTRLQEAVKLANEKKFAEAVAKVKEAQAQAKTPFDTFTTQQFLVTFASQSGDSAGALRALEQIIDSQYLDEGARFKYVKFMTAFYYQTKSYAKTIEFGQRWLKSTPGDVDAIVLVGQSYFLQKDCKNAIKYMDQAIDASEHSGKPLKENYYKIKLQCVTDAGSAAGQLEVFQQLVEHFPSREYWNQLLILSRRDVPDRVLLQMYRLMYDTDNVNTPAEYMEMAQLAIEFGYPGEAQNVLERGFSTKVLENDKDVDRFRRLLDGAKKEADGDKRSLPLLDKESRNAKTGDADVKLGFAYLTYGDSAKAIEAMERGIGKGGVKNMAEAKIFLGMAYMKAKRTDDAKKAFREGKDDQILGKVAKLWLLRAGQS
jgi:tetratricopeptide (TPR) repeat protein